jgi:drug/metabolite transporter (DMT)-like permease
VATAAAPVRDDARRQRRGQVYVALAAIAWSSAGVLQRQLTLDTATQVAGRAAFAGLSLLVYVAVVERGRVLEACRSVGVAGVGVAVCMAVASGGFIAALNQTTVARVLFMLALAPVLAAALAWLTLGEPIGRRTMFAMAMALGGVTVMVGAPGAGNLAGDAIAFLTVLGFALALVITRHRQEVSMAPATILSQALLVLVFAPFATPSEIGGGDTVWLALLGAGQIGLGLVLLTIGARLIPAAQVALITLLEVVLGPIWVWIALGERPDSATLIGGAIVIAAIVVQTRGDRAPAPGADGAPVAPP